MVNAIRFAVIIPVYNAGNYLADCLESLIAQSYHNWIAYCVNDGSTDHSERILDEYSRVDSRIRVFSKKNGGVASARNYALERIDDEEWISFLDADDYISPCFFSDIINAINNSKEKGIDYIRLFPKKTNLRYTDVGEWKCKSLVERSCYAVSNVEYFKNEDVGGYVASIIVKAEIVMNRKVRFINTMKILEDQVFSIECATYAKAILMCPGEYYFYYSNNNSATSKSCDRSNDIIQCMNNVRIISNNTSNPAFQDFYYNRFLPNKVHALLNERIRHILSSTSNKIDDFFKIAFVNMSTMDYIKYYLLKIMNKI